MDMRPAFPGAPAPLTPPVRVVLIEDDTDLRDSLADLIGLAGFEVLTGKSALEFYQILASQPFEIAILDVGLPDQDGFSIVEHLKANHHRHGIIMLTARDGTEDRIQGFRRGADLYFTKPADGRELVAAITSLALRLRATDPHPAAAETAPPAALSAGEATGPEPGTADWRLDPQQWALRAPSGLSVSLTAQEMRLLGCFLTAPDGIATRSALLGSIGKNPVETEDRSLDAAIRRLRRKVEQAIGQDLPLKTVPTKGYQFTAPLR